jgi:hypothetical protein
MATAGTRPWPLQDGKLPHVTRLGGLGDMEYGTVIIEQRMHLYCITPLQFLYRSMARRSAVQDEGLVQPYE